MKRQGRSKTSIAPEVKNITSYSQFCESIYRKVLRIFHQNRSLLPFNSAQKDKNRTFSAHFSPKDLHVSKRVRTFASQLGHGVMVTLQVLVLSFWVRIPVTQQNALIGCVLDADHRRIFLFLPSAIRKARGMYDCASSFCPLFPSSSSHLWLL